ncbi:MAG: alpha/beta hydrolase [Clostridia bacterium]|jgi:acetyl esterase/lipase|nr:alpha/beta hydrolase [Clostridia bacterium]
MNKKRKVVAIIATILFAIAIVDILLYVYFFKGNITSKVPEGIRERCNVKEEKFQERNVFVLTPKGKKKTKKAVFYLHGGSYIAELTPTYWNFLSDLTQDTGATIIVPDYPLAPQYHYKDVFNMIIPLYKETTKKVKAENLIIMGDSAGGGMGLALVKKIGQEELTEPSKTILISPWLDVTMENPEIKKVQEKDKMLNTELLRLAGISYAGERENTKNHHISPIYGPMEKLENVVIYTGTYDILNPDVHRLQEIAKKKRS